MTTRQRFDEFSRMAAGKFQRAARVICRCCGATEAININTAHSLLPASVITKKFTSLGWDIGKNENWDICPDCQKKEKEKPVLKIVPPKPDASLAAPREMSKDDSRIIFEKLNEVYIDQENGYSAGWSDTRAAEDLGVPRKWVETIRAQFFGELATSKDQKDFSLETQRLVTEARSVLEEARRIKREIEQAMASPVWNNLTAISDRIGKLEKTAKELARAS